MRCVVSFLAIVCLAGCIKSAHSEPTEKAEAGPIGVAAFTAADDGRGPSKCPQGMIEVEGEYCPHVEQICLRWVEADGSPAETPPPGKTGRCGEWKFPSRCLSARTEHRRFCIDKFEYPNVEGQRPQSWMTWHDVKSACAAQGKRMCTRSEWTFACEGTEMKPYPYGDGYHRDRTACNFDNPMPAEIKDIHKVTRRDSPQGRLLDGLLVPSGSMPRCVSPFGVYDMVGNIDEQIVNEAGRPYISGLMSGHVFGVRNACRPMTEAHGPEFSWYETGGRCCSDTLGDADAR